MQAEIKQLTFEQAISNVQHGIDRGVQKGIFNLAEAVSMNAALVTIVEEVEALKQRVASLENPNTIKA